MAKYVHDTVNIIFNARVRNAGTPFDIDDAKDAKALTERFKGLRKLKSKSKPKSKPKSKLDNDPDNDPLDKDEEANEEQDEQVDNDETIDPPADVAYARGGGWFEFNGKSYREDKLPPGVIINNE